MSKKAKGKKKAKKSASKKSIKKAVKKKTVKKKTARKKTAKKKAKKPLKKKTAKKITRKKPVAKAKPASKKPVQVQPGPAAVAVQPIEEPTQSEEAIGIVTHYYSHLNVAVVQLNKGILKTGQTIHIKGGTTDFTQQVESMEYEHQHLDEVRAGQTFGLKVKDHAREHDIVYLAK